MQHPAWKQLLEVLQPLVNSGKAEFTYDELKELSGLDIQTNQGRSQFERFRRKALEQWSVWFEVEIGQGYRVIQAKEHVNSAGARVKRANRLNKRALAIVQNCRFEEMNNADRSLALQAQAVIAALVQAGREASPKIGKLQGQLVLPDQQKAVARVNGRS